VRRKTALWGLLALLLLYLAPGAVLLGVQERLLFPAPVIDVAVLDGLAAESGAVPLRLHAEDGTSLYAWHRPAEGGVTRDRAVLLFGGNAEPVSGRVQLHDLLAGLGWDVFVVAYRGYPGSEGSPSEAGLRQDAAVMWGHVTQTLGIRPERVVVHGKSLGGGVAAMLVEQVPVGALVLESTFLSIPDVAREQYWMYPLEWLVRHPFRTVDRAPGISVPALVLHSDADELIPVAQGRALATLLPRAIYVEAEGRGHSESLILTDPACRRAYLGLLEDIEEAL
jgi:pimeloyl-ACP methyl ester carboxylesterase